jgi:phosphatidylglycerophosphate synthase
MIVAVRAGTRLQIVSMLCTMMVGMIDRSLRRVKDRLLDSIGRGVLVRLHAQTVTVVALLMALGAAVIAAFELSSQARWPWRLAAVGAWLVSRALDGVDGSVARARGTQSDRGGYLDMMCDTLAYAAVPIGLAIAADSQSAWMWCALLLATYYVNTMSWTYLSSIEERRAAASLHGDGGLQTTIAMPAGLIEGFETMVLVAVMLAWPAHLELWFAVTAGLVAITACVRVVTGLRRL